MAYIGTRVLDGITNATYVKLELAEAHVAPDDVELLLLAVLLAADAELPEPAAVEVAPSAGGEGQEDQLHPQHVGPLRLGVTAANVHLVLDYLRSTRERAGLVENLVEKTPGKIGCQTPYRVTIIQEVPNLLLTLEQKLQFSIRRIY